MQVSLSVRSFHFFLGIGSSAFYCINARKMSLKQKWTRSPKTGPKIDFVGNFIISFCRKSHKSRVPGSRDFGAKLCQPIRSSITYDLFDIFLIFGMQSQNYERERLRLHQVWDLPAGLPGCAQHDTFICNTFY